ncbi:MAG: hypothetical protein EBZ59_05515 [Planctomycetia bacterium]|nr:hypothetical protein [Planctomycetia bacterium]
MMRHPSPMLPGRHAAASASRERRRRSPRTSVGFESLESRRLLATYTVSNLNDAGDGSLRKAITDVNTAAVPATIAFDSLASGTIALASALPEIATSGTTFSFTGSTTAITLDGTAARGASGLTIRSGVNNVSLAGLKLTIQNFDSSGISFAGGSTNSTIRGLTIANNASGISLEGGACTDTIIAGNTIRQNARDGIMISGSGTGGGVTGLTIGGTGAGAGNTITGNLDGLYVGPGTYTGTVVQGNTIQSNSDDGIELWANAGSLTGLVIGGTAAGAGNTIASNSDCGLVVSNGAYAGTLVQGNTIRYNVAHGVNLNQAAGDAAFSGLVVGGGSGAGNTISNNGLDGVLVNAGPYSSTAVQGNQIVSNGRNGVNFYALFGERVTGFQLGGTATGEGNAIRTNAADGVTASAGDYTQTVVTGNAIVGNRTGVNLTGARNLAVGGVAAGAGNTIDSNIDRGLSATGDLTGATVYGNTISSNPFGVWLQDARSLAFGSAASGGRNTLAGGTTGLRAAGDMSGSTVLGNSFLNQASGIQLVGATGGSASQPFIVGAATAAAGNGAGNYVVSTHNGLYATGILTNTIVSGNVFSASVFGGNAMLLEHATWLTVGGPLATQGNTLQAVQGNALWATGALAGTGFFRNTLSGSLNGVILNGAQNFNFGVRGNAAMANLVQYNRTGLTAVGNCIGSGVYNTAWYRNAARVVNRSVGLSVSPRA